MFRLLIVSVLCVLSFKVQASDVKLFAIKLTINHTGFSHENGSPVIETFSCKLNDLSIQDYDQQGWDDGATDWKSIHILRYNCSNAITGNFEINFEDRKQHYRGISTPDHMISSELNGKIDSQRTLNASGISSRILYDNLFLNKLTKLCSTSGYVAQAIQIENNHVTVCVEKPGTNLRR
ncbi:MAG: hypothetical protein SGI74_06390 [Oligoflexia bacterium]|nr:hypothetical protein [Oligoflexia bacterium]